MPGGIRVDLASVVSASDDLSVTRDDRADGHVAVRDRLTRRAERFAHEALVVGRTRDGRGVGERDAGTILPRAHMPR